MVLLTLLLVQVTIRLPLLVEGVVPPVTTRLTSA